MSAAFPQPGTERNALKHAAAAAAVELEQDAMVIGLGDGSVRRRGGVGSDRTATRTSA
jgi:hypothetical protein